MAIRERRVQEKDEVKCERRAHASPLFFLTAHASPHLPSFTKSERTPRCRFATTAPTEQSFPLFFVFKDFFIFLINDVAF
jgi:hypothetical protein